MKKIIALLVVSSLILAGCSRITNSGKKSKDGVNRSDIKAGAAVESSNIEVSTDVEIVDAPPEPISLSDGSQDTGPFAA